MAKTIVSVKEIKSCEELLNAFSMWANMGSEKRLKEIKRRNENDRRFTIKKGECWISFYDTGAVYVATGKYHNIKLWQGYDPLNRYIHKNGVIDEYKLVYNYDNPVYSMQNITLVKAINKALG